MIAAPPPQTLSALLAERVARHGDAPALIYRDRPTSFAELADLAGRLATGLAELGIAKGERIAFWLPNATAYLALTFAAARIGAIAVAINTRFRSHEVGDIIARSGAKAMVLWPGFRGIDFLGILAEVGGADLADLETLILYDEGEPADRLPAPVGHCRLVRYGELASRPPRNADDAAADIGSNMFTTSGTTKAPKFVLHPQRSLAQHAHEVAAGFGYGEGDALILALPMCGVFGFTQILAGIASGRPTVLFSAFDAPAMADAIDRYRVAHMNASDDMIVALLDQRADTPAFPTIRFSGFAPFNASIEDIVGLAEARGLRLCGLYGMSEVQALYARQPRDAPIEQRRLGGGVLVSPTARVRVRDPDTGALLADGESGELELAGPSRMLEYFADPQASAEAIGADGFLRSGDLGYRTDYGFVFSSRMGDVLRLGGFLVSPAEIEAFVGRHPAVEGCQVVGVATEQGPRPVAFVVPAAGAAGAGFAEDAVIAHCAGGLAGFKVPARVIALEEFPTTRSANGTKIQRARLREMAEAALNG